MARKTKKAPAVEEPLAAKPWLEQVAFVDCPYCHESCDLGADVCWGNLEPYECDHCARTFLLEGEGP